MRTGPAPLAVAAASIAVATALGCGLGPGDADEGTSSLRVTRDYGSELIAEASIDDPTESDTVIRELDRAAEIETRYGGGFVQSIEGLSGRIEGGRSFDWFFYVNGIESSIGSAEVEVHAGDRIWWDYRDWTAAMRVPAVVGSWPEPFAQTAAGSDLAPVRVECAAARSPCDAAVEALASAGVDASIEQYRASGSPPGEPLRLLVGEWSRIRGDQTAALLDDGPASSGVFARFQRRGTGGWSLEGLDVEAQRELTMGAGSGLVAALRPADDPPVWIVTGADPAGVDAAVGLLADSELRDRYAVATEAGEQTALPVAAGGEG